jgi:hypothetical protein
MSPAKSCALLLTLLACLLRGERLIAQTPTPRDFVVHAADADDKTGVLDSIGEDWSVSLSGPDRKISGRDLITLRRAAVPLPAPPSGTHIVLLNGDMLPGKALQSRLDNLRFQVDTGKTQEVSVPLSAVSLLWFSAPTDAEKPSVLRRRLAAARRRRDQVLLRNGDRIDGSLVEVGPDSIRLEGDGRKVIQISQDKLAAIALSSDFSRSLRSREPYAHVVLANGGRLSFASAHADARTLFGKTHFGATVEIPLEQLVRLDVRQGRAVYLSDLKPARYEHTPYLGVHWPWVRDGSVAGDDLALAGNVCDKGVGMHSESRLTYDLAGQYRWFEALVGLDDRTGKEGSVRVQVAVDGAVHEIGGELRSVDGARPVRLRVAGARQLTVLVLFGQHGDVQDHLDWVDARLIK